MEETKSPEAAEQPLVAPHHGQIHVLASICYLCFRLCIFTALQDWGLI